MITSSPLSFGFTIYHLGRHEFGVRVVCCRKNTKMMQKDGADISQDLSDHPYEKTTTIIGICISEEIRLPILDVLLCWKNRLYNDLAVLFDNCAR